MTISTLIKSQGIAFSLVMLIANANAQFNNLDKVPTAPPADAAPAPPAPETPPADGQSKKLHGCVIGKESYSINVDLTKGGTIIWEIVAAPVGGGSGSRSVHYLTLGSLGLYLDNSLLPQSSVADVPSWWAAIRDTLHMAAVSNTAIGVSSGPDGRVTSISVSWGTPCPFPTGY